MDNKSIKKILSTSFCSHHILPLKRGGKRFFFLLSTALNQLVIAVRLAMVLAGLTSRCLDALWNPNLASSTVPVNWSIITPEVRHCYVHVTTWEPQCHTTWLNVANQPSRDRLISSITAEASWDIVVRKEYWFNKVIKRVKEIKKSDVIFCIFRSLDLI